MEEEFTYLSGKEIPVFPVGKKIMSMLSSCNENTGVFMLKNDSVVGVYVSEELYDKVSRKNASDKIIEEVGEILGVDLREDYGLNNNNFSGFVASAIKKLCRYESIWQDMGIAKKVGSLPLQNLNQGLAMKETNSRSEEVVIEEVDKVLDEYLPSFIRDDKYLMSLINKERDSK